MAEQSGNFILAPWEQEEVENNPTQMLVSNLSSLSNIQAVHGLVSECAYWTSENTFRGDILKTVEQAKTDLLNKLKEKTHKMGGNAILGFVLDVDIRHSPYRSGAVAVSSVAIGAVSVIFGITINAYGTAVTLSKP